MYLGVNVLTKIPTNIFLRISVLASKNNVIPHSAAADAKFVQNTGGPQLARFQLKYGFCKKSLRKDETLTS